MLHAREIECLDTVTNVMALFRPFTSQQIIGTGTPTAHYHRDPAQHIKNCYCSIVESFLECNKSVGQNECGEVRNSAAAGTQT